MSLAKDILGSGKKKINVTGVPGAGKTQLVHDMAAIASSLRILYLSFGNENTKSAKRRLPDNVTCSSFHAYAKKQLNINSNRLIGRFGMSEAQKILKHLGSPLGEAKLLDAFVALNELFCMMSTPINRVHDILNTHRKVLPSLSKDEAEQICLAYRKFWHASWEKGASFPVTHDMYFKAYALNPEPLSYDYLIVDEVQDLNEAMFTLVNGLSAASPNTRIVKLGDPCQQIFAFRGSSQQFTHEQFDFALDESWRFGQALCDISNRFMSRQGISYYTPIKSKHDRTKVMDAISISEVVEKVRRGIKPTFLARYNMTLWHMLKHMAKAEIKCALNGGDNKELFFLRSLYSLSKGEKVNHPSLRGMTYRQFKNLSAANHDNSSTMACKFVDSLNGEGEHVFESLQRNLTTPQKAQVLLSTVHQAKGLEFKHVIMMDDFPKCTDPDTGVFLPIKRDEAHVIYTAMTRAKVTLVLPKSWAKKNPAL